VIDIHAIILPATMRGVHPTESSRLKRLALSERVARRP
jgi:hypothetical protein